MGRIEHPIQHWPKLHESLERNWRKIETQPSNFGTEGEFKELSIHFPDGAVINLRFRRAASKDQPQGRGEDRYNLTDINLRLELVGLGPEAIRAIKK